MAAGAQVVETALGEVFAKGCSVDRTSGVRRSSKVRLGCRRWKRNAGRPGARRAHLYSEVDDPGLPGITPASLGVAVRNRVVPVRVGEEGGRSQFFVVTYYLKVVFDNSGNAASE